MACGIDSRVAIAGFFHAEESPENRQSAPTEIRDLADSLMFLADMVERASGWDDELRDPADPPVLQTLLAAQARDLVTVDKDLLALAPRHPIITPADFRSRHGA